jgi:hypothetical protein
MALTGRGSRCVERVTPNQEKRNDMYKEEGREVGKI